MIFIDMIDPVVQRMPTAVRMLSSTKNSTWHMKQLCYLKIRLIKELGMPSYLLLPPIIDKVRVYIPYYKEAGNIDATTRDNCIQEQ